MTQCTQARYIPTNSVVLHPSTGVIGILMHSSPLTPGKPSSWLERAPLPLISIERGDLLELLITPACLARQWLATHVHTEAQVGQTITITWYDQEQHSINRVTGIVEDTMHPYYAVKQDSTIYHGKLVLITDEFIR